LFADSIVSTIFPGFVGIEKSLLSSLFSIQAIISVISVALGVLNALNYAQNKLYRTILGPILAVLVQFLFVYFTHQGYGIYSVVWALGLSQIFIFIFLAYGALYRYRPIIVVNRRLRYVSSRMIPLVLSSTFSKSDIFVNRYFASLLDVGSITILHYGLLSITSLSSIVDKGVGIISLRNFSLITNSDKARFTEYFKKIYLIMIYLVMTISAFVLIFSSYFLEFIFLGEKFSGEQVNKLSIVVILFLGVFVGGVLSSVLVNAFYSKGLTAIVSKMSITIQTVSIAAKIIFYNAYGFYALPIVTSAHYLVASFCLIILYDKYIFRLDYLYFLRALVGSCVVFLILIFTLHTITERFFPFI
jgi:peptidoglycan biosynthesis protein MviN/MurJ (putative lipid II flippase)